MNPQSEPVINKAREWVITIIIIAKTDRAGRISCVVIDHSRTCPGKVKDEEKNQKTLNVIVIDDDDDDDYVVVVLLTPLVVSDRVCRHRPFESCAPLLQVLCFRPEE